MNTNIYISPHFDDAVFSCPASMINDIKNGVHVIVITVFSNNGSRSSAENMLRRAENNAALNLLKAQSIELGYDDAPHRNNYYNSFNKLIFQRHSDDNIELTCDIKKKINTLCDQYSPAMIYAPLGVGTHIDHRLCFEAMSQITNHQVSFYEDRPYCFALHSVEARLKMIGVDLNANSIFESILNKQYIDEHIKSFTNMPYVKKYLTEKRDKEKCFDTITHQIKNNYLIRYSAIGNIMSFSFENKNEILGITSEYKSQILPFIESMNKYSQQLDKYSRSISDNNCINERYWKLLEVIGSY